jgi:hypothetical protein
MGTWSTPCKNTEQHGEPNLIWFLNDADCLLAIHAAKPALLNYYDTEVHGSWKADICRVAALDGGSSFGVA